MFKMNRKLLLVLFISIALLLAGCTAKEFTATFYKNNPNTPKD